MQAISDNYLWIGILIAIVALCLFRHRGSSAPYGQTGGAATFIPAEPWIEAPEYPAPYRTDRFYLGGSTKCFSCEKDLMDRGQYPYKARPTMCFDCEAQARQQFGPMGAQFGQPSKCFSCENAPNPYRMPRQKLCGSLIKRPSCPFARRDSFGQAAGQAYNDIPPSPSVGLTKGFGSAEGLDRHEADTANPIDYRVS